MSAASVDAEHSSYASSSYASEDEYASDYYGETTSEDDTSLLRRQSSSYDESDDDAIDHPSIAALPEKSERAAVVEFVDGTHSRESSRSPTPRLRMRVALPDYVYACRLIASRQDVRFTTAIGRLRISFNVDAVRAGRVQPKFHYRIEPDRTLQRELARTRRRHVILSLRVHEQDARRMPVDCQVSMMGAPRPYVVRRSRVASCLNEELINDGVAFLNEPCSLVFSSLDALDFDATALSDVDGIASETASVSTERSTTTTTTTGIEPPRASSVAVLRSYHHAALLRQVAMAQQLMNMDNLMRSCATQSSLTNAPLQGTDVWLYPNAHVLNSAIHFVEHRLVPSTRRLFDPNQQPHFDALPMLPGSMSTSWASHLAPHVSAKSPHLFDASVQFIMHLASVPAAPDST